MEGLIRLLGRVLMAVCAAAVLSSLATVGDAFAQTQSREQACRENANSELCICWNVNVAHTQWMLMEEMTTPGGRRVARVGTPLRELSLRGYLHDVIFEQRQFPDEPDKFKEVVSGQYAGDRPAVSAPGVVPAVFPFFMTLNVEGAVGRDYEISPRLVENKNYKRDCAFTFLEEDLRRIWQIAGMVVGALLTITVSWAGVVHMQETASGNSLARTRMIITRAIVGAIIVGGCYIIIDAINVELFGMADFWWTQEGQLFEGIIYQTPKDP